MRGKWRGVSEQRTLPRLVCSGSLVPRPRCALPVLIDLMAVILVRDEQFWRPGSKFSRTVVVTFPYRVHKNTAP